MAREPVVSIRAYRPYTPPGLAIADLRARGVSSRDSRPRLQRRHICTGDGDPETGTVISDALPWRRAHASDAHLGLPQLGQRHRTGTGRPTGASIARNSVADEMGLGMPSQLPYPLLAGRRSMPPMFLESHLERGPTTARQDSVLAGEGSPAHILLPPPRRNGSPLLTVRGQRKGLCRRNEAKGALPLAELGCSF